MSLHACKENALAMVDVASPERPNGNEALGLLFSAILHGVVLLLVLVVGIFGSEGSEGGLEIVPVEVELIQQSQPAPAEQQAPALPQPNSAQSPSDPTPDGAAHLTEPVKDELQAKLEALAKFRQPDVLTPNRENGAARPDRMAAHDDITSGLQGPFSVKDYIRAQVERRWNFDLANLGSNDFAVPIHVEITNAGVVLKADIVDSPRTNDPRYREVAVSARNAVLLSSPISLPAGDYDHVMDMVLDLNPRDALR
jgi:hypothetical protein